MTHHYIDHNNPTKCICGERLGHAPMRLASERGHKVCATPNCNRVAAWISIGEGNVLGSTAPRRCKVCCDAIGAAIETLLTRWQLTPIPPQNDTVTSLPDGPESLYTNAIDAADTPPQLG